MANLRVDKQLFDFIQSVRKVADLRGVAPGNPVVIRVTIPISAHLVIVVCSMEEPTTAILPLNALWLNLNGSSGNYLRLMQRLEKNTGVNGFTHKWMNVDTFATLDIIQEYDDEDKERLQASINVGTASSNRLGLVRLSVQPLSSSNPVAVGANDPRLSNARTPLPHTHAMPPITQIKTATGIITVDQTVTPENGMILYATSPTSVTWKHLVHSDLTSV